MCGINGFNFRNEQLIQKMNRAIKHRGPDAEGVLVQDNFCLGHVRLSIIDLSAKANQPLFSRDGRYAIIYNGELYNFQEIKDDLLTKGYQFSSSSDTEVILNAYLEYGEQCLERFNGIFAFAILDKNTGDFLAARDHLGIKPFFYYWHEGKLIFSSEIKGILVHDIDRQLDIVALNNFFYFLYIAAPRTIFIKVKKLPAGSYLKLKNNKLEIKKYWQPKTEKINMNFSEAKNKVRQVFDQSVSRQLISDRPLGLFLSGGLDSTAILGSMAKTATGTIKTFSVGFEVEEQVDKFNQDSILAKQSAEYYHTDHHELILKPADVADNLEAVVYHADDLISNHIQTAMYLLAKKTKEQVAVVLSGDGGDELFAGYNRYYYYQLIDKLQHIPKALRKNFILKYLTKIFHQESNYKKLNVDSAFDLFTQFRMQKNSGIDKFLQADWQRFNQVKEEIKEKHFLEKSDSFVNQLMAVDQQTWLIDEALAKADHMTMAWGLEQRVPILDKELVELAATIPNKFKINSRNQGKYIFREAVKDYLPDYIYNKPKTGWFSPASKWLRTGLKDMAYEVLSPNYNPDTQQYFDFTEIKKILDNHLDKSHYALNTVWSLMIFQIWYKIFKSTDSMDKFKNK